MKISHLLFTLAGLLAAHVTATEEPTDPLPVDLEATVDAGLENIWQLVEEASNSTTTRKRSGDSTCTLKKLQIRREWGSLSKNERKAYTDAVLCLQSLPSRTPPTLIPGARSRFDDFVGVHIQQTQTIHYTANFLAWHRYFVHAYELALKQECGYTGTQPYWNWGLYASAPQDSPIFDGSAYSMGGTGTPTPHEGYQLLMPGYDPIVLEPGLGGGCVTDGPFKDMKVNLGPVASVYLPPNGDGLSYNPRCLSRDVNPSVNQRFASHRAILSLLTKPKNIMDFQMQMQGVPGSGDIGVHGGGHYTISGEPGADVFTSPGDPAFYLHHGMVDRTWTVWQALDMRNRQNAIAGTRTFLNQPPSDEATLDDLVDLGYAHSPPMKIRDLMSTIKGPFCYIYL